MKEVFKDLCVFFTFLQARCVQNRIPQLYDYHENFHERTKIQKSHATGSTQRSQKFSTESEVGGLPQL